MVLFARNGIQVREIPGAREVGFPVVGPGLGSAVLRCKQSLGVKDREGSGGLVLCFFSLGY